MARQRRRTDCGLTLTTPKHPGLRPISEEADCDNRTFHFPIGPRFTSGFPERPELPDIRPEGHLPRRSQDACTTRFRSFGRGAACRRPSGRRPCLRRITPGVAVVRISTITDRVCRPPPGALSGVPGVRAAMKFEWHPLDPAPSEAARNNVPGPSIRYCSARHRSGPAT